MYILKCNDGTFYVGSCRNVELRMEQHYAGLGSTYTSKRQPVELLYCEEYARMADAYAREKQVQGWSRAKRLALIEGRFDDLKGLSKPGSHVPRA
jgi:putative endonuclease